MIAFASLFLGLVVGLQPVTVFVQGPVAAVSFELDGKTVGRTARPPWTLKVDFGAELSPHELVARAFDGEGRELGETRQFLNLPRPPAEVDVLLEHDAKGKAVAARLSAQSLVGGLPSRVSAAFDGSPLFSLDPGRFELPDYDLEARHVLTVEFEFSSAVSSRTDVVLGGGASSVARSELTAVALRRGSDGPFPGTADLAGALSASGRELPIVAVEGGPALVCVVRSPTIDLALKALGTGGRTSFVMQPGTTRRLPQFDRDFGRYAMALEAEDILRFVWPVARPAPASPAELYDASHDYAGKDGGVHWLLTRVEHPERPVKDLHFADAAAVAGLQASAAGSRRAIVLVLGGESRDASRHTPAAVRRYLAAIRVPLFVWSLKSPSSQPLAAAWGKVEDVSTADKLEAAVLRLKAELALQRIVWVQGRHLPQDISLSEKFPGLDFAH
ncbi:MAG TPA: hypothetical protein VGS00_01395 [Thermoanaerobaculia bacterium]|nr:hypothetical protein [Thermoanaerobaculia bacterium]